MSTEPEQIEITSTWRLPKANVRDRLYQIATAVEEAGGEFVHEPKAPDDGPPKLVVLERPRCPSCQRTLPLRVRSTPENTESAKRQHLKCGHCEYTWQIYWQ